jgi:hypothetical protein
LWGNQEVYCREDFALIPLVLLANVGCKQGKDDGSGKGTMMGSGLLGH